MKNLKAPFLAFALILFSVSIVSAYNNPPPPEMYVEADANAGDENLTGSGFGNRIGPGPRLPIDQNKIILLIGGLALGATIIYRKQIKKASN